MGKYTDLEIEIEDLKTSVSEKEEEIETLNSEISNLTSEVVDLKLLQVKPIYFIIKDRNIIEKLSKKHCTIDYRNTNFLIGRFEGLDDALTKFLNTIIKSDVEFMTEREFVVINKELI